jgi:hypothetical protein
MKRPFDQATILGQIGENTVCRMLRDADFSVERNCDGLPRDGRGPSVAVPGKEPIPRPDLVVSNRGVSIPAEVKTKTDRTKGILTKEWETGIDHKRWIDYRDFERATGQQMVLVIVEYSKTVAQWLLANERINSDFERNGRTDFVQAPDHVMAQWLASLNPSLNKPTFCYGKSMVYFAVRQFRNDWLEFLASIVSQRATRFT